MTTDISHFSFCSAVAIYSFLFEYLSSLLHRNGQILHFCVTLLVIQHFLVIPSAFLYLCTRFIHRKEIYKCPLQSGWSFHRKSEISCGFSISVSNLKSACLRAFYSDVCFIKFIDFCLKNSLFYNFGGFFSSSFY